jgi:aminomethyltransferase
MCRTQVTGARGLSSRIYPRSMEPTAKRTPLYEVHRHLGARMMPFAGYEMPVQYSGILDEHRAVRERAGLFDVSHMGEIRATGPGAFAFVQGLVSNDAGKLTDGRAMYAVMCHDDGGIVDDLLVYRIAEDDYLLVVNASNVEKDWAHMNAHNAAGADLENISDEVALLALQGPKAFEIAERATGLSLSDLPYYHFRVPAPGALVGSRFAVVSHTGYTGEAGLELFVDAGRAEALWGALMEAGAEVDLRPAGLGARDTLRLEAGYSLYGNDLTDTTTPLEAGLGWVTKLDKGDFVGREALAQQKEAGVPRRLVAFVMEDRCIPRHGQTLVDEAGQTLGEVTSGTQSPTLGRGIGMGYVPNDPRYTAPGSAVFVEQRGQRFRARVAKPPLHKEAA